MKKVAFIINFHPQKWLGGFNYIYNLIYFLHKYKIKNIKPVIITNNIKYLLSPHNIPKTKILVTNLVSKNSTIKNIFDKLQIVIFGKNFFLEKFLLNKKIYATSHFGFTGRNSKIKSFTWFPDFQEIYYPNNFSFKLRFLRLINLYFASKNSTNLLISSNSALTDLKKINKKYISKALLIKHAINLPKIESFSYSNEVLKKYNLNQRFFFLPNHLWKHKNHMVVLKAINYLKDKINFQVVATGFFEDQRDVGYSESVKQYIEKNHLKKYFIHLGVVPLQDMTLLMLRSIALINPSKFEGWSNTVEQAKSLGKKIILSNITTHKEQIGKNFFYFNPDSYFELSIILLKLSKNFKEIKNFKKNITSYKKYEKKQKQFILKYVKIF
jgi:hypothetical protein